jgi:HrpA-like RNA helicase
MSQLLRDLLLHLHATETDPDAVILVFLPTYRALLLQHKLLQESALGSSLDVFALHSSVDIDEALEAIQGSRVSGRRRVVLATNCAESSITLPNVKHVVDSCTTNQV